MTLTQIDLIDGTTVYINEDMIVMKIEVDDTPTYRYLLATGDYITSTTDLG